jgi:hypothetical protein
VRAVRGFVMVGIAMAIALASSACGPANERPDLAGAIDAAVASAGNNGVVDLGAILPLEWDTVYDFPAYTSDAEISETTGADFGSSRDSQINSDGLNLVVLTNRGEIAAWFVLNEGDPLVAVRFHEDLHGQPIPRDEAVFTTITRELTTGGYDLYYLMPRN